MLAWRCALRLLVRRPVDNAPEHRLRLTDLANAVLLSSGGLTRLVGRLEDRRLVRCEPDAVDARGFHPAGQARARPAGRTHDAVIEELLGSRLSPAEVTMLTRILGRVL